MGTPTAWAHLPNAPHIDCILAHVRAHPLAWATALGAARGAAWRAAYDAARTAAYNAAQDAARAAAWAAARDADWDAILALIAWDDAGLLLDMPADAVRLLAASGHQPAVLMLPARITIASTT